MDIVDTLFHGLALIVREYNGTKDINRFGDLLIEFIATLREVDMTAEQRYILVKQLNKVTEELCKIVISGEHKTIILI